MDEQDPKPADLESAEREDAEAAALEELAEADDRVRTAGGSGRTHVRATLAIQDRAVALELEIEAEYLRAKAAAEPR